MLGKLDSGIAARIIDEALAEDLSLGDPTTEATIAPDASATGVILVKQNGVVAGLEVASEVFRRVDEQLTFTPLVSDGDFVAAMTEAARVSGRAASLLKAERTALNFLQRMSGIATLTRAFVGAVAGTGVKITDTRKTAPCLRFFDKWAVRLGGGVNHRMALHDMILIKDNHVALAGGVRAALRACKRYQELHQLDLPIEIEARSIRDVEEIMIEGGVSRIMFDNFTTEMLREAVALVGNAVETEASGSITLDRVSEIAETGVDFISIGALTHSARALDISFEILS